MATTEPYITNKSIVIAGAGISGLSLVISLSKRWPTDLRSSRPTVTILERDSESNRIGREGYTISLRSDGERGGGIQILDNLDLYSIVKDNSVSKFGGSGSMIIWDSNWNEIIRVDSEKVANNTTRKLESMRIRRNALQKTLAEAAKEAGAEILWEREIVDMRRSETSDEMEVITADGDIMKCDLLIAGDGSKSLIRSRLRPHDKLDFAGPVLMTGTARFATREEIPRPLEKDWGLLLSNGTGIGSFLAPVDERSVLWSVSQLSKEPKKQFKHPMPAEKTEELLESARELGRHGGPKFRELIDKTDPTTLMMFNCMDRPPFAHHPEQHGPVIWIGDSNHAVSPFAGNGANMALMDGWDLAGCLTSATTLEQCLQDYDKLVIPRTRSVRSQSRWNMAVAHARGWRLTMYWYILKILGFFFGKSGT